MTKTSITIKFLTWTALIATLLVGVNSIDMPDGNNILKAEAVHASSSDNNNKNQLTQDHAHAGADASHSHSHSHTHNDHEYHDYSYLHELKKTMDPNNEMSHMEFVESLRAKDPSFNETVK